MLARIFKSHSSQETSQPARAEAQPAKPNVKAPAVLGECETWTRKGDAAAPQAPQRHAMELVPPKRGQGEGQGCYFSDEKFCAPCMCLDVSDGMKGVLCCCIPVCFSG